MIATKNLLHPHRLTVIWQFKITLQDISPPIWRRIQVPKDYSFWDLHVAITDSMPWLDYHLHSFTIKNPKTGKKDQIGIPDDDGELEFLPCWEKYVSRYFAPKNNRAVYEYDFGDGWEHEILLEEALVPEPRTVYPRCIAGERSGPPEDVGGVGGYEEFLKTIADQTPKNHEERESMLRWAEKLTGQYPFDPEKFDPDKVHFDDPDKRWRIAFQGEEPSPGMRMTEGES